jgi:hypothetical protein
MFDRKIFCAKSTTFFFITTCIYFYIKSARLQKGPHRTKIHQNPKGGGQDDDVTETGEQLAEVGVTRDATDTWNPNELTVLFDGLRRSRKLTLFFFGRSKVLLEQIDEG